MRRADEILALMAVPDMIERRELTFGGGRRGALLFQPDLCDKEDIRNILFALEKTGGKPNTETLLKSVMYSAEASCETDKDAAVLAVLSGDTVFIGEGIEEYIIVSTRKWDKRAVNEPPTETVLRGPREGFIEDIKTNLSLLERRLKTPAFAVERYVVGRSSKTSVALCYISTIASPHMIKLIREKLTAIDIDALVDSHYLQPLLEPHPYSIFHQTGVTEKPDVVVAKLLEGRVAVVVDGSPMVLTAPFLFIEDFQSSSDYYERNAFSTFLRMLRYIAALIGIFLPGTYVALQIFHYNIIPVKFLVTLMNAVKGIPLTPLPETLFVILLFEIIREGSVRMPRALGVAMSIVGALVLGETAVAAGMISSPAVMAIALSSISLYSVPNEVGTFSLLRIAFTIIGGIAGLYGLIIGVLFLMFRLSNLDSFGTPYLAPFAPLLPHDFKDALVRAPLRDLDTRPESIPNINHTRKK